MSLLPLHLLGSPVLRQHSAEVRSVDDEVRRLVQSAVAEETVAHLEQFKEARSQARAADGPTEVHKMTVARQLLRDYKPSDDTWPTEWIPKKLEAARAKFADYIEHEVGNL